MHLAFRSAGAAVLSALLVVLVAASAAAQREPADKDDFADLAAAAPGPKPSIAAHNVGQLTVGVTNFGMIGIGRGKNQRIDCFTGRPVPKGEYPKGSRSVYLYEGGLWVGGVVGGDSLVSTGAEFNNYNFEFWPTQPITTYSNVDPDDPNSALAKSEQDYYATYVDTMPVSSYDPIANRGHKPLGLRVEQASYAWSYPHTDDFIIITWQIKNISRKAISDVWVGIYWDADVHLQGIGDMLNRPDYGKPLTDGRDDLAGFMYTVPSADETCPGSDTIGLAWTADNEGDYSSTTGLFAVPNVGAIRFLGPELTDRRYRVNYNWWVYNYSSGYDYGPQKRDRYRDLGNGPGTPYGDVNRYFMMSNGERDFDMVYTYGIGQNDPVWVPPSRYTSWAMSRGGDVQQVLSVGPRYLAPGSEITVAMAFVCGSGLHYNPVNFRRKMLQAFEPDEYYAGLDFSNLLANAQTAGRVYDIPGFDSNGDGYLGKMRECVVDSAFVDGRWVATALDTSWYEGDGIPDLKAAGPPPAPEFSLHPIRNGVKVLFYGLQSETTRDIFSNQFDFEGYRVYLARDNRESSFSLVGQYDREDYDKWVLVQKPGRDAQYYRQGDPFTRGFLRCAYGQGPNPCADSAFDPLHYTISRPYVHPLYPDSVFYFTAHDYNQYAFGAGTSIRKVYPAQEPPVSLQAPAPEDTTKEGLFKYYLYEMDIPDLLPSVQYYVVVTAFDFGSPETGLAPQESARTVYAKPAYPNNAWDEKPDSLTNVYVYPNPYRHDAYYRVSGFEGRGEEDRSRDRVRKITFANLPHQCTIRIFTLDGDLVKELNHDIPSSDPNSSYHEWDMVSRNFQMIVSGLYYWVVETPDGRHQVGKLVILL